MVIAELSNRSAVQNVFKCTVVNESEMCCGPIDGQMTLIYIPATKWRIVDRPDIPLLVHPNRTISSVG